MSSSVDIKLTLGQRNAIKEVHSVKHQTFELNRLPAARNRKEKGKREGRVRGDGTKGGPGSEEQHSNSGNKSKKEKDSEVRGSLLDVII